MELVEDALELAYSDASASVALIKDFTEDQITDRVLCGVRGTGFAASHDGYVNGHCDINIAFCGFAWLGEAKILGDNGILYGGFEQLTTRYWKPASNDECGGLLVYCKKDNAVTRVSDWLDFLTAKDGNRDPAPCRALEGRTKHRETGTGLEIRVLHKFLPLYHAPKA
ncbi:hypothetical protein AB4059_13380 [Lysobacter sp. 2RAF19]